MKLYPRSRFALALLLTPVMPVLGQAGLPPGYNRIVSSSDLSISPDPTGSGWHISARVYFANTEAAPADLSGTFYLGLNGSPVLAMPVSMLASGPSGGGGDCFSTCAASVGCLTCKPSSIPGFPCWCCTHSADISAIVPALNGGDVITAVFEPGPGSLPELDSADDYGFFVMPRSIPWNRVLETSTLVYSHGTGGNMRISGAIGHATSYGTAGDLSSAVAIYDGPILIGGGGSAGSTDLITYGNGIPGGSAGPYGPVLFSCSFFCNSCTGYDVNNCFPTGLNPDPFCMCVQQNVQLTGPQAGWHVDVPPLDPETLVTVTIAPRPGSLPEIDTSDDTFTVRIRDITRCPADLGQQGGLPVGDHILDNNDFVVFIQFFFTEDLRADLGVQGGTPGADGELDNNDFVVFIQLFFEGC